MTTRSIEIPKTKSYYNFKTDIDNEEGIFDPTGKSPTDSPWLEKLQKRMAIYGTIHTIPCSKILNVTYFTK
tara:strand:+ start:534 stop:746 length:213 start_codon:yes stop_codon:yes gene_type:complete